METYTLPELTERAGRALDALGVRVGSRRVRQRPDARTVRYYSQVGLVDRPLPSAGREARYGHRHLVQLVAVKRLQEAGVTLAEIQRRLAGAAEEELLAAIGPAAADLLGTADAAPEVASPRVAAFWRARPAADAAPVGAATHDGVRQVLVVRLAPGVELAVDPAACGTVGDVDVEALRAAARPLVAHLRTRTADEEDGE